MGIISDDYRITTAVFEDSTKDSDEIVTFGMLNGSLRTYQWRGYPDRDELCAIILDDFGGDIHMKGLSDVLDDYYSGKWDVGAVGYNE